MLCSPLFASRLSLLALPLLTLCAVSCSDDDGDLDAEHAVGTAGVTGVAGSPTGDAGARDAAGGHAGSIAAGGGDPGAAGTPNGAGNAGEGGENGEVLDGLGPRPVSLGKSGAYVVLAKSAISNVPTSSITGDLGLSPAAASYITGFSMARAGTRWTSSQVSGFLFAADNDAPTANDLTVAVQDMMAAYTDAAGRANPDFLNLGAGTIADRTLAPGLYRWASSLTIPGDVTLAGTENDVWILQITGDLVFSAAKAITLSGGAKASHVFWQVAGLVDLGKASHLEGIALSKTAIELRTGATVNGRLLAQTAVNLAGNTITAPAP